MLKTDRSSEPHLHLAGNVEMIKDRFVAFVELNDFLALRCDERQVIADLLINLLIIDLNGGEIGAEHIPDNTECPSHFFAHETHRFFLLERLDRLSPSLHQEP